MRFILEDKNGYVTMRLEYPEDTDMLLSWDKAIDMVAEELSAWPDARRMSYDIWYWPRHKADKANEFITYYMLKTSDLP